MEQIIYDRMAELDTRHWWYRARRDILHTLIGRKISPGANAKILEVGCGTGHNLAMLGSFGKVDAIELYADARVIASKRLGHPVFDARLPELAGISRGHYDLVAALDVVEHVEDDVAALKALGDCLAPGGRILVTVPAFRWMWSGHDVANHHFRRYTQTSLRAAIAAAGLKIEFIGWYNSILFPLAAIDRLIARVTGREGSTDTMPSAVINWLFGTIFALEKHLIGRVPMTPGVSIAAVISLPAAQS